MPTHDEIYVHHASSYDRLVAREDHEGNLLPAIHSKVNLQSANVLELGAGTGRLTALLAPHVHHIHAFDVSAHMLERAATRLTGAGLTNWSVALASHDRLPVHPEAVDLVIAGWSLCYDVVKDRFDAERLDRLLADFRRRVKPGGAIMIIETLGTGHDVPQPPASLAPYYAHLEESGFSSAWIRTDYHFTSPEEAEELVRFFFGDELADSVRSRRSVTLPECTGLWWLELS